MYFHQKKMFFLEQNYLDFSFNLVHSFHYLISVFLKLVKFVFKGVMGDCEFVNDFSIVVGHSFNRGGN